MIELLKLLAIGGLRKRYLGNNTSGIFYTAKDKKYEHASVYKIGGRFTASRIRPDGTVGSKCVSEDRNEVAGFLLGGSV